MSRLILIGLDEQERLRGVLPRELHGLIADSASLPVRVVERAGTSWPVHAVFCRITEGCGCCCGGINV